MKTSTAKYRIDLIDLRLRLPEGIVAVLLGCLLSAIMGAAFFKAHLEDPEFTSFSGSFVRVLASLVLIVSTASTELRFQFQLSPLQHKSLWAWGFFGALTVTTYFSAINLIGSGTTAFLSASSGLFIAALAPLLAKQKPKPITWVAIFGGILGTYFLSAHSMRQDSLLGTITALLSGLFGAIAYLMIARTREKYRVSTLMMTWSLSALIAHLAIFCFAPPIWPSNQAAWLYLGLAGASASLAMHFTTLAFQKAPAVLVASLSYLAPLLSLLF
ncbi:MAG: DMT family transporter, partial [Bdellovibrionales bacterium]|nr:DMT family transporter [Bdellovibrionales bacterium]